jgi:hypothetical protein
MVKNEADIIEAFVRHNIVYLDHMDIIDNNSTDGTRDILAALQKEGLPVTIHDDPVFGYFQAQKTTALFHKVVPTHHPDIVFLLDADEFIIAESRSLIDVVLSQIPNGNIGLIPWNTYVPCPDITGGLIQDVLRQVTHKREKEFSYAKCVISLSSIDTSSLLIGQGNDRVSIEVGKYVSWVGIPGVSLGHFPVRSLEQITSKVVNGWIAYIDRGYAIGEEGYQWKILYDKIVHGAGLQVEEVSQCALTYSSPDKWVWPENVIYQPMKPNYDCLKYNNLGKRSAVSNIANSFEHWMRASKNNSLGNALKDTQFLIFEIGSECNLAHCHPKCPVKQRKREGRPLDDYTIIRHVEDAYTRFGFKGLVGWHYYNEPMMQIDRVLGLMEKIRVLVPTSRFVLWTNGTIISEDPRMKLFGQVHVSDYFNQRDSLIEAYKGIVSLDVFTPNFDNRLDDVCINSDVHCFRPYVELVFDNFGEAHMCCQDWKGEINVGNLWRNDFGAILERRNQIISQVCGDTMTADAPERCLKCPNRIMDKSIVLNLGVKNGRMA